jgi:hypothetical protein
MILHKVTLPKEPRQAKVLSLAFFADDNATKNACVNEPLIFKQILNLALVHFGSD